MGRVEVPVISVDYGFIGAGDEGVAKSEGEVRAGKELAKLLVVTDRRSKAIAVAAVACAPALSRTVWPAVGKASITYRVDIEQ